jgi:hypothetical protein
LESHGQPRVQPFPARQRSGNGGQAKGTTSTLTIENGQFIGPKLLPLIMVPSDEQNLSKILFSESTSFYVFVVYLTMLSVI